ncbi:adenosylcobinamide-GDP ribazoletransferase [Nonomuraea longicatena]|uniref:Adenosylcobinamide-GDP ribazoletransferase n=1 Tax=Nonomuraea longicatena TaxID=83682 RepID=A0ABN1PT83_9ACTN
MDGLRFAVGTLTAVPVRVTRVDRTVAGRAMLLAPLVGLALGLVAALPLALPVAPPLGALLAIGALALLTRGLHLDGLADLADGLGSAKPAPQALDIMKKSDIGPFGVLALLFVIGIQTFALAEVHELPAGQVAVLATACVTGRLALAWACRSGVPAARPGGLGAMVAQTVRPRAAWAATALVLLAACAAGPLTGRVYALPLAALAGLGAALLLLRHAERRLGGVTGDVLGALVETAVTTALVVTAIVA